MIRTLAHYVDIDTGKLLDPATWYELNEIPVAKRGDTVEVELNFKKLTTVSPRAYGDAALEDIGSFFVGIKQWKEFAATAFLAQTEVVTVAGAKLTFTIELTSDPLAAKLTGSTEKCQSVLEVEYTDADGKDTLAAFRFDILNDYIKGTEGSPAPSVPTYYTAAQVQALIASIISVPDGTRLKVNEDGTTVLEELES
jgi:hypothetical protein